MSAENEKPQPGDDVLVFTVDISGPSKMMLVYGVGIYEGDAIPPVVTMLGGEMDISKLALTLTPRIRLSSGEIVWGGEILFTPLTDEHGRIHAIETAISEGYSIRTVDIRKVRVQQYGLDTPEARN